MASHTQLVCKFVVAFEDFNKVVKHAKINGDLCRHFLEQICFFCSAYMKVFCICVGEQAGKDGKDGQWAENGGEEMYQRRSCFELAIFMASTTVLTPLAARTTLQFSKIQCNWCSDEVVSANVPGPIA